jgi:hypothetical protein
MRGVLEGPIADDMISSLEMAGVGTIGSAYLALYGKRCTSRPLSPAVWRTFLALLVTRHLPSEQRISGSAPKR